MKFLYESSLDSTVVPTWDLIDRSVVFLGPELLPRLALSASMETNRGSLSPIGTCGQHAQTQSNRFQSGGVRGRIREATVDPRLCLSKTSEDGGQLQEPADQSR